MDKDKRYFFITTYDTISGAIIASLLNAHPDIKCSEKSQVKKNIDALIKESGEDAEIFYGDTQSFSAHALQNAMLAERTHASLCKINLTVSPELRIHFLMIGWLDKHKSAEAALEDELGAENNETTVHLRRVFEHLTATAAQEMVDLENRMNQLFLLALAKVITQDTLDFLVPGSSVSLEKMIQNKNSLIDLIKTLTSRLVMMNADYLTGLQPQLNQLKHFISELQARTWEPWQRQLLNKYLSINLQLLGFPHVTRPLTEFYKELGYNTAAHDPREITYTKLISIHLNSNRPAQLNLYFDSIEETADDPGLVEVLVNIDDHDTAMREMLEREIPRRSFAIKYLTSPRPASFCDLWKPINKLLNITDPGAYFLLNVSDEMLFATRGWDTILKSYVGFFPDHIFRLRTSRNKFRNYFDRWECSFAQDSIPITTKKWVEIGGDWNPCFGPDSFQQLVAFYLAREGRYYNKNYLRELPIINIKFHGDIPSLGIPAEKVWRLNHDHIKAMQICQSYSMQTEARRRAILLKAHIFAYESQLTNFCVTDDKSNKIIRLINADNGEVAGEFAYSLNWFAIFLTNQLRKLRFYAYFGGGKEYKRNIIKSFGAYLSATHFKVYDLRQQLKRRMRA
jgi:hypothetical protein